MIDERIKIYFIEDNPVLSLWLTHYLGSMECVETVGSATSGRKGVEGIIATQPHLALVDIGLPDISGIQVTKEVKAALPGTRVVILTASDDEKHIFGALEAGADGYVLKSNGSPKLEPAIKSVRLGSVWLDPAIAELVLQDNEQRLKRPQAGRKTLTRLEIVRLEGVAASNCHDGICLVEPDFVSKLKRLQSVEKGASA